MQNNGLCPRKTLWVLPLVLICVLESRWLTSLLLFLYGLRGRRLTRIGGRVETLGDFLADSRNGFV